MNQSQVPSAPNLDILTETVTDTGAAAPSATAHMQTILGELDKAIGAYHWLCRSFITGRAGTTLQTPSTPWFNQVITNLQLCLDQASSRSESAAFLL